MKDLIISLALLSMISTPSLSAAELGEGSSGAAKAAQSSNWQNWAVAGGAIVAAAIGVIIVATNNGSLSTHH
jgi:hypothetical protein